MSGVRPGSNEWGCWQGCTRGGAYVRTTAEWVVEWCTIPGAAQDGALHVKRGHLIEVVQVVSFVLVLDRTQLGEATQRQLVCRQLASLPQVLPVVVDATLPHVACVT